MALTSAPARRLMKVDLKRMSPPIRGVAVPLVGDLVVKFGSAPPERRATGLVDLSSERTVPNMSPREVGYAPRPDSG